MAERIVDVRDLRYQTGSRYLLKDIHWQIDKGENWLLFGLNGCGKTTLLSIIAGYRGFLQGEVAVFGQAKLDLNERRRIAFVSSSFFDKFYREEAVLDIVLSGKFGTLGIGNRVEDQDILKAKRLLSAFQVGLMVNKPYHQLSKGERQNVLLARAMMGEPSLFILDEPCSGLDIAARAEVLAGIGRLARDPAKTVIYVTHYADEILEDFEHTLLMKNGRISHKGATKTLLTASVLSEFMERPLTCAWTDGHFQVDFR